jgi:hypothetical protein
MNNIYKHLEFKQTEEGNKTINYLHIHIHRNNNIQPGIYRKPTQSDTTIHFTSNHPLQQTKKTKQNKTKTCSIYLLYKEIVIYTHYRPSKTTGMDYLM